MFLTIVTLFSLASAAPPAARWCSAPSIAAWPLDHLRRVLAEGGPDIEHLYAMPRVSPDSATQVTDERICERAARVYYRFRLGPIPGGGVAVIRVGTRFAVYGDNRAGEWTILSIYSDEFELITGIAL